MSNPMAQSEPVEQRFGAPAQPEAPNAEVPTRQIDGTDVVERGTLAAENVTPSLVSTSLTSASSTASLLAPRTRCAWT